MKDISHLKNKSLTVPLCNISNKGKDIYLFCRDKTGKQNIYKDTSFYPFFFEPDPNGKYIGYDGIKLKKIIVSEPKAVPGMRSERSYSSDIRYPIVYITHKINKFKLAPLKLLFIDIEVLANQFPHPEQAKYPVSCITSYSNFSKKYKTFYLKDYKSPTRQGQEKQLLDDFIAYIKHEAPDLWLSWNVEFDYTYLHNRISWFAKKISPIGMVRMGKGENIFFPAGISIVDQKGLFEKLTLNKRAAYSLDHIAQVDLGEEAWGSTKFSELDDEQVKAKNIHDVERMVKLEKKFQIIPYFNEIRLFAKCLWEDLPQETIKREGFLQKVSNNSRIIDSLLLAEARKRNIILPSKNRDYSHKEHFQGAFRESFGTGVFNNLVKLDLASAYPNMIIDFCLDPNNISETPIKDSVKISIYDRLTKSKTGTYYFRQNEEALLSTTIKDLLEVKDKLKNNLNNTNVNSSEYDNLKLKYDAIKSIVNSYWGVLGNRFFRLYDNRIAETITFLVRDLLLYVKEQLDELGHKVIYMDTDSCFVEGDKDISKLLNKIIQKWAKEKYKKDFLNIEFDYEGIFEKIMILAKCHYYGYLKTKKGIKKEVKGLEMKRSNSSKFEAKFQEELIEKLLNKENKLDILKWIKIKKQDLKELGLDEIGFPCKVADRIYKNEPIFIRALKNTQILNKDFIVEKGELFYYTYVISLGKGANDKDMDVLAFSKENNSFIKRSRIDWSELIRRNIDNKSDNLFEALGWKQKNKPMVNAELL